MSNNTVERTEGSHVIECKVDPAVAIAKGEAVVFSGDYLITTLTDQNTFPQGVALKAATLGAYVTIPVLVPGPILNVKAGAILTAGALINGDAAVPGEWIADTTDPAGFVVLGGGDGDQIDICFVGEQI